VTNATLISVIFGRKAYNILGLKKTRILQNVFLGFSVFLDFLAFNVRRPDTKL